MSSTGEIRATVDQGLESLKKAPVTAIRESVQQLGVLSTRLGQVVETGSAAVQDISRVLWALSGSHQEASASVDAGISILGPLSLESDNTHMAGAATSTVAAMDAGRGVGNSCMQAVALTIELLALMNQAKEKAAALAEVQRTIDQPSIDFIAHVGAAIEHGTTYVEGL